MSDVYGRNLLRTAAEHVREVAGQHEDVDDYRDTVDDTLADLLDLLADDAGDGRLISHTADAARLLARAILDVPAPEGGAA